MQRILSFWTLRWVMTIAIGLISFGAAAREAERVRPGLMWNKTGLPAVFPLQVKTALGLDYYLTLTDEKTGAPALAAYIEGGTFFKVLVPPGKFTVRFAAGEDWQGEDALFGAETEQFEMSQPLSFAVTGFNTKSGHVLDLTKTMGREASNVVVSPQSICQTYSMVSWPLAFGSDEMRHTRKYIDVLEHDERQAWQPKYRPQDEEPFAQKVESPLRRPKPTGTLLESPSDEFAYKWDDPSLWLQPRFEVRTRPCLDPDR